MSYSFWRPQPWRPGALAPLCPLATPLTWGWHCQSANSGGVFENIQLLIKETLDFTILILCLAKSMVSIQLTIRFEDQCKIRCIRQRSEAPLANR